MKKDEGARPGPSLTANTLAAYVSSAGGQKSTASQLIEIPGAFLTRSHLRELGFERRAVDSIFRALPVVVLDGYRRPMVKVEDFLTLIAERTCPGDRVVR